MLQPRPRSKPPSDPPLGDETAFIRSFLDNPKRTGAVAPSGPYLAREMARMVDPARGGQVIELGPGTGPVTRALITRGFARERLLLVEYEAYFCRMLAERFPLAQVVGGDAYDLKKTLAGRVRGPVTAVVSSLPLLNEKPERRIRLLEDAFDLMGPDGVFVQFTYGVTSPMPREGLGDRYVARCGAPVLRNLPPASVWTYRSRAHGPAPQPKIMKLIDQAEQFGVQFTAKRKAAGTMLSQQRDKVRDMIVRETASAFRRGRDCGDPDRR